MCLSVGDGMKIQFEWPALRQPVELDKRLTAENSAVLDVVSGDFAITNSRPERDVVAFYWHLSRPVIVNLCVEHLCSLDSVELKYGSVHSLRPGSKIQAGHFKLSLARESDVETEEQTFYQLIYPGSDLQASNKIPEVEEVLPNGGSNINDLHYFNELALAEDKGNDILKRLEAEYKYFLIWQKQGRGEYHDVSQYEKYTIKTDDRFDRIREQVKGKTLTECIIARDFLMEKVWPDFETGESFDDFFQQEEKTDLLKALSPEYIVAKNKDRVPELVFQDFYKVGLDSHY